jgi:hypothetical protein
MSNILTAEEARAIARPSVERLVEIACGEIKNGAFNGKTIIEIESELIINIRHCDPNLYSDFVQAMIEKGYKYQGWWFDSRNKNLSYTRFYF